MGKAARWFRCLRGLKKEESQSQSAAKPPKRRWTFVKSHRERDGTAANNITDDPTGCTGGDGGGGVDPSKHAIAVAAATAAVAEAAVAAAQAAQAVVKLTSSGRSNASAVYVSGASCGVREEWAAVTIQSHFRGYLARRALRALKGLVKLQALVRGHIVRKKTKDMVRRMQALLRAQARACAGRAQVSESPHSSNKSSQFQGPATPEKFEHDISSKITKHDQSPMLLKRSGSKSIARVIIDQDKARNGWNGLDHRMDEGSRDQKRLSTKTGQTDNEKSDKILEVDSGKLHLASKRKNLFLFNPHGLASDQYSHSFSTSKDSTTRQTVLSPSSCEVHSLNPLKFTQDNEESPFCTANNSPQFYSASSRSGSSRRGPFTPCKSDGSRSNLSGYSDHPNYMACTESSRAKVRSLSAPKQRPQFERSVSTKRYSVHGFGESRSRSQRVSALNANFANKAYPGSGHLDRLAMPVRGDAIGA